MHNHPERLDAPAPPAAGRTRRTAGRVATCRLPPWQPLPAQFTSTSAGRNWQQIDAFARRLQFRAPPHHWLDWCSGKGHLGRRLAHAGGTPLTCLESRRRAGRGRPAPQRSPGAAGAPPHQDVLAGDAAAQLDAGHTPVALHACGELHVRLLELASRKGCRQLAVAPCCYNRIASEHYRPLSQPARDSALPLSRDDLRLPLAETVTAGARVRRQRDRSMARRLAFDLLQRELRGVDDYLPMPSLAPAWLDKPFAAYCRELAALRDLPEPGERDWAALEAAGWQRLAEVRNLELVRGLFRRPLELWLLLDRALYLEEQGYRVRLGSFCDYHLTPRNILLLAERDERRPGTIACQGLHHGVRAVPTRACLMKRSGAPPPSRLTQERGSHLSPDRMPKRRRRPRGAPSVGDCTLQPQRPYSTPPPSALNRAISPDSWARRLAISCWRAANSWRWASSRVSWLSTPAR